MNKYEAKKLVTDTFQNSFDRTKFNYFVKNLLNYFDESKAFHAHGYVKEEFKKTAGIVKTYERLGTYTDPEGNKIDILIVYLGKQNSLDRARTTLRNFIADYLRQRNMKEAALVAFVSPDFIDWRFSLVKMEYKISQTPSGNIKAKEEFTPAKRFSFLVGQEEHTHTAQSRLVPIIQDDVNNPTLKELEDAFNIEKVTREFFEKYRELFLRVRESLDEIVRKDEKIKADFLAKGVITVDFAKKLLGQIVFLYFLQKKGWFGVERDKDWGTGSKQFLRELFETKHGSYKNFFNNVLEPLFYQALRNDRSYDDHYFSQFNCKIPFLNGGLFDPINDYDWIKTDILLDNNLFSNDSPTKEGDIGDGILDIFDRYNFTVKEDEPLEKEVAIDPEMLGKVFENLLEVKDRKSKGTYYTPREIVHYMCQQSLINYLATELENNVSQKDTETLIKFGDTTIEHDKNLVDKEKNSESFKLPKSIIKQAQTIDEKLADIRVCDPAIGSGAFLVGMMTEIIKARSSLTPHLKNQANRSFYDFKREAIEKSLYGVDIDLGAVEIAKLRLWLSLIVDEEDIKQIKPLPNLDYKIMQGNSLIEFTSPESLAKTTDHARSELIDQYNQFKQEYLSTYDPRQKKAKRDQINQLIENIMIYDKKRQIETDKTWQKYQQRQQENLFGEEKEQLALGGLSEKEKEKLSRQIEEFNKLKQASLQDHFEWHLNFNEVFKKKGGFDVIMANPPYVGHKGGQKKFFQEMKKASLGKRFNNERMDLFYYFFHLALDIAGHKGEIAFITTNYYITADSAIKLRTDFKIRANIRKLVNFNELKIFDSAQGQHNMLTFLCKNSNLSCEIFLASRTGLATLEILRTILNKEDKETYYYEITQHDLYEGENNYIRLFYGADNNLKIVGGILDKLIDQGIRLGEICKISQGVVTGLDKISTKHIKKIPSLSEKLGSGVFVVNNYEKKRIGESPLFKPWFKNSDIHKYKVNENNDKWLIHLNAEVKLEEFKNIEDHLLNYKDIIQTRNYDSGELSKAKKLKSWWALSSSRKEFDFSKPKIVSPQRSYTNTFAYTDEEWLSSADVYFIIPKNFDYAVKYILALLNSELYLLWLYNKGKRKGKMLELYLTPLSEIPIKKISEGDQKPFIEIVDKILAITKSKDYLQSSTKQAEVNEYEKQIDQLVYKLYGLSEEEIKIVENNAK